MDSSAEEGELVRLLDPRHHPVNWLLLAVPVAVAAEFGSWGESWVFAASMLAIVPLAWLLGQATEEIALHTSEGVGGLLNATFGNAVELIIAFLALRAGLLEVVQASLIGSILGNLLLVLGLAFLLGGVRRREQRFNVTAAGANCSLLVLAMLALTIPAAFAATAADDTEGLGQLSHYTALLLLLIYGLFLLFQLRTHGHLYGAAQAHQEPPRLALRWGVGLLLVITLLVAWMAELLVGTLAHVAAEWGLSQLFIGVILIPVVGNAAEHMTAVTAAMKDKMDLSLGVAVGSSIQIALFIAPLLVLVSWATGAGLTLEFGLFATTAAFMAVLIVNFIAFDGRSNWLEGAMLLVAYAILALAFLFHP